MASNSIAASAVSVGSAFHVDFGQLYNIMQYSIRYTYMHYNQPGMTNSYILGRHELAPNPTFAFGKSIPAGQNGHPSPPVFKKSLKID